MSFSIYWRWAQQSPYLMAQRPSQGTCHKSHRDTTAKKLEKYMFNKNILYKKDKKFIMGDVLYLSTIVWCSITLLARILL